MLKIEKVENLQEKIDSIFVEQAKEHNIDSNYKDFKFAVKDIMVIFWVVLRDIDYLKISM